MKTQTVTLGIYQRALDDDIGLYPAGHIDVTTTKRDHPAINADGGWVKIGEHVVEVPIPERLDLTAQAIEALETKADSIMEKARAEVARVREQIANLRCLTHDNGVEGE